MAELDLPITHDPNKDLAPFVEGMIAGAVDWQRFEDFCDFTGWTIEHTTVDGLLGIVATSPSGLRWRLRAELVADTAVVGGPTR